MLAARRVIPILQDRGKAADELAEMLASQPDVQRRMLAVISIATPMANAFDCIGMAIDA